MAFYQNSIPKNQGHLNVARTAAEEPHIAQATTAMAQPGKRLSSNLVHEADPGVRDAGYTNAAPGVTVWHPCAPVRHGHMSSSPDLELGYNPNLLTTDRGSSVDQVSNEAIPSSVHGPYVGNRISVSAMDQVVSGGTLVERDTGNVEEQWGSDLGMPHLRNRGSGGGTSWPVEGGRNDSVSGKKVKLLCSFGGKILPRMGDLKLTYDGGETKVIGVRRDVSFDELMKKMVDTYGQPVVIKYLLRDLHHQALVCVSCPEDLDNMMEEYEKLVKRSSDGSAQLPVFLFSASEPDPPGVIQFGELHGSGQRYVETQQFVSSVHMPVVPASSQVGLRPAVVLPPLHLQQTQSGHEDMTGHRSVLVASEKNQNAYWIQAPSPMAGGGYSRNQVYPTGQVVYPSGWTTAHQQPETVQRFEECAMRQKALSHSHSDTMLQDQRESTVGHIPISSSIHHSLEDNIKSRPINGAVVSGAPREDNIEPGNGAQHIAYVKMLAGDVKARHENERNASQKVANRDPKEHVMGPVGNEKFPYGPLSGVIPECSPLSVAKQHFVPAQCQPKQEVLTSKSVVVDTCAVRGKPVRTSEYQAGESPREYSRLAGAKADNMEILHISPPNVLANIERSWLPGDDQQREEILKPMVQLNIKGEVPPNDSYIIPQTIQATSSRVTDQPVPGVHNVHDLQPVKSHNLSQPPNVSIPRPNSQSRMGVQSDPGVYYGNPPLSGVRPASETEQKNDASLVQLTAVHHDVRHINSNCRADDFQDHSKSPLKNQDPWNLNPGSHFRPPIPTKIMLRKDGSGTKAPFLDHQSGKIGQLSTEEMQKENGIQQPYNKLTDYTSPEHFPPSKGSAESHIKQKLQNVADFVAASVPKSALPSNPDLRVSEDNEPAHEAGQEKDMQHEADAEDLDSQAQRGNSHFPVSDDLGHLQIIKNSDLEEVRKVGSGTYGTVFHGKWKGTDVAIKRINDRCFQRKPLEQEHMRSDFLKEAKKLADLRHPNVLTFYGIVVDVPGGSVATITEYMVDGSLRKALRSNGRSLDMHQCLLIAMDVAIGMEYLHGKNIVHSDLKSDNLLVNLKDPHRPICKVGDLGLSKVKCQTLVSGDARGTLPWMAPELLDGSSSHASEKADVFSFGIVMWEILTGKEPYADLHHNAIMGGILSHKLRPNIPELCDPDWRSLMERCWSSVPQERPSFTEIREQLRTLETRICPKMQNHT